MNWFQVILALSFLGCSNIDSSSKHSYLLRFNSLTIGEEIFDIPRDFTFGESCDTSNWKNDCILLDSTGNTLSIFDGVVSEITIRNMNIIHQKFGVEFSQERLMDEMRHFDRNIYCQEQDRLCVSSSNNVEFHWKQNTSGELIEFRVKLVPVT